MKILLVTGERAENKTREIANRYNCSVLVAPIEVASFLTPNHILKEVDPKDYDLILVPGIMRGDLRALERQLGINVFRGPKNISDLEFILENIEEIELSKEIPACELAEERLRKRALKEIKKTETLRYKKRMLKNPWNVLVGSLPVGRDFPLRVLAEIADANLMDDKEILQRAEYYIKSGADIIDIGISDKNPGRVEGIIKLLKKLNIPLSIDTMVEDNIERAIDCSIDLILSFDGLLLEKFHGIKVPSVIIPDRKNIPKSPKERIYALEKNIELAKDRGFESIIADLILEPVNFGFTNSIIAYKNFSERYEYPILMGVGNVTELFDADSIGINALISGIAMECNAGIVFTPEHSYKTRGSIKELALASKMMFLAKSRDTHPKDLGVDMLVLKEKKPSTVTIDKTLLEDIRHIKAESKRDFIEDKKGFFKVFVNESIKVLHMQGNKAKLIIEGRRAKDIGNTILRLSLVSDLSHALYLGRELEKAEIALKTGKSYVQDFDIFVKKYKEE